MAMNTKLKRIPLPATRKRLPPPCQRPLPAARQRGAALLALVGMLMLVGAGVLIKRVNARVQFSPQLSAQTGVVLKQAKTALIARAVIDANRPGELPCPDVNYDGQTILNTDFSGGANSPCTRLLGWLPWRTLDIPDLRDASGTRLWYGLSDAWHAGHSAALNPDATGGVTLNGFGNPDIVAVIIAPGADLKSDSDPRPDETSSAMNATNLALVQKYLEAANGDGTPTTYVNQAGVSFNDRLVIITRAELIAAVQRRVAGELAVALSAYRATNGSYPWLSNNTAPLAANPEFDGLPGIRNGYIAYLDMSISETGAFRSGFSVNWHRDMGSVPDVKADTMKLDIDTSALAWGTPGIDPMTDAVRDALDDIGIDPVPGTIKLYVLKADKDQKMKKGVKNALKNDPPPGSDNPLNPQTVVMPTTATAGALCDWQNVDGRVDCDYSDTSVAPYVSVALCVKGTGFDECPPLLANSTVSRTRVLNLHYQQGTPTTSATSGARTRDVLSLTDPDPPLFVAFTSLTGDFKSSPTGTTMISFIDRLDSPFDIFFAARALIPSDNDDAIFNTTGIYAESKSDGTLPGDLPAWFYVNNWGPYLRVSYAANFIPNGTGTCNPAANECINLSVPNSPPRNDIEAVVVSAGVLLPATTPPQTRGAGSVLSDLFEDNNNIVDDNVDRKTGTTTFNDHLRLVACATGPAVDCR